MFDKVIVDKNTMVLNPFYEIVFILQNDFPFFNRLLRAYVNINYSVFHNLTLSY